MWVCIHHLARITHLLVLSSCSCSDCSSCWSSGARYTLHAPRAHYPDQFLSTSLAHSTSKFELRLAKCMSYVCSCTFELAAAYLNLQLLILASPDDDAIWPLVWYGLICTVMCTHCSYIFCINCHWLSILFHIIHYTSTNAILVYLKFNNDSTEHCYSIEISFLHMLK